MIFRRSLLQRLGALLALGSAGLLRTDTKPRIGAPDVAAAVTALVDLIIPADPADDPPGAVGLGIDRQILAGAADRGFAALLIAGTQWLDTQARTRGAQRFVALSPADQTAIAHEAEAAPDTAGGLLFATLRQRTMSAYYTHPRVTAAFPYAGPPQPEGFADFAQAPRERS